MQRRFRWLSVARLSAACLFAFALALAPRGARAQAVQGFALDRFEPAVAGSDWFTVESLDLRGRLRPALGVTADWAWKPLVLVGPDGDERTAVVRHQLLFHLGAAVTLFDRLRLAASLPVAAVNTGDPAQVGALTYGAPDGPGVGDLRLTGDVRLFGTYRGPISVALGAHLFLPTGDRADYLGEGKTRVAPRLTVAGDLGPLAYALRVGYEWRRSIDRSLFQDVGVGSELDVAAAVGLRFGDRVLVGPELFGSTVLEDGNAFERRATPLELLLGAHVVVADDWRIGAGVSPGLTEGLGTPRVRGVARVQYLPAIAKAPADRDGDGVADRADACPDAPGVATDDPRTNGCPPDRDGDGIVDAEDACPAEAGVRTADPKTNGCPPPADRDKDGIVDAEDACPEAAGPRSDDPAKNGCPPPADRDKDGIVDAEDACPDVPGKKTGDPATNGCADRDGDGVFDPVDACPDVPGIQDPDRAKNGCPLARVEREQIRILQQVKFKTGSAEILPESHEVLAAVVKVLAEHPEIKKVRVEGHTDNVGGAAFNKRLSQRRAASVVKHLVGSGIDKGRLVARGVGLEAPIAPNDTDEGRRENRRVEFHIVDPPPAAARPEKQ